MINTDTMSCGSSRRRTILGKMSVLRKRSMHFASNHLQYLTDKKQLSATFCSAYISWRAHRIEGGNNIIAKTQTGGREGSPAAAALGGRPNVAAFSGGRDTAEALPMVAHRGHPRRTLPPTSRKMIG